MQDNQKTMSTYKLVLAYDGTAYSGWQIQPNALSIQEVLESALALLFRNKIKITASGRTDSGVHALGQVAHFRYSKNIDFTRFIKSINGILPYDIRIKSIEKVFDDFHARYLAIGKSYHYHLWLECVQDPFKRKYAWHVRSNVNRELLKKATVYFIGEHDFTSFSNSSNEGACAKNSIRTICHVNVIEQYGGLRIEMEGNGFLYKMVRNIVGTLVEVATSKLELSMLPKLFEAKDRKVVGKTAPAQGLFLASVLYP